jgi:ABC-type branched-subunit amino acid transport system substrate-binding protein
MRRLLACCFGALLLLGACSTGDPGDDEASPDDSTPAGESATFPPDDRATGVTDDAIRVGVTYPDLAALGDIVDLDHGDYEAAYTALADQINEAGGINGRQVELVFAPVSPIGTAPADEACTQLTEDEQVFAVVGFGIDDVPLCYTELHNTPFIGGYPTAARLERSTAPWFSYLSAEDSLAPKIIDAVNGEGVFDDATVGVVSLAETEQLAEDTIIPALEDAGVDVADTAVIDAPPEDQAAALQQVGVIAERFASEGIDVVVTSGNASLTWLQGIEGTDYRPQLIGTQFESLETYLQGSGGGEQEVLENAITGGPPPARVLWTQDEMQECADTIGAATGAEPTDPNEDTGDTPDTFVSVIYACQGMDLFAGIAEAAGEDLDNGTFGQAGYDLGLFELAGVSSGAIYGPDSRDGDQPLYLLRYDPGTGTLVPDEDAAA